jgi:DNA helicase II / ATP-dependent DNA helicase PcrA
MPEPTSIILNTQQTQAVQAPLSPMLVLAGPGTGKTRVLTERIAHLISHHKIDPQHILALTFTNKAAGEMTARLIRTLTEDIAQAVFMGTFHSFCVHALREHHETVGLPEHFGIADDELQRTILYRAFPRLNPNESNLNNVLQAIDRLKRQKRYYPHVPMKKGDQNLLETYEAELKQNRLVDFDDLIFLTHDLLQTHHSILQTYQTQFQHILVDEFQDTDQEQYALVKMLAQQHKNIFVVADDEQSIFSWRHANPENLTRFQEDFMVGKPPIVLEENYRSAVEILNLARAFIANNPVLFDRTVYAQRTGSRVRGLLFDSFHAEGQFIAGDIWERIRENADLAHHDIAVLYPQHAIGSELEKIFMTANVPCQMAHKRGLFDQPVIKRALSVLRYALDGENDASLELFLRRELEGVDPALYPAIRKFQYTKNITTFKQAAFLYPRTVSEEEGLEVSRALGLAGVVHNAVQRGAVSSLPNLVDDILDQLNTSNLPSLQNHLNQIIDPLTLPEMHAVLERTLPLYRKGGTFYIACRDEVLRHLLTTLIRDALSRPGVIVREADPGSRLALGPDTIVLSFDQEPPKSTTAFLHLGAMATEIGPMIIALKFCQAIACADIPATLTDYTVLDIRATNDNPEQAEITEIGAVRIRNGEETENFHTFLKSENSTTDAPTFQEVYLTLQSFVGIDVIVSHNGYAFDFQVLAREARRNGRARLPNPTLDTLPMARCYCPDANANLTLLCERYNILQPQADATTQDTCQILHKIFEAMKIERTSRYRRMKFERILDQVALGMLFQKLYTDVSGFSHEDHLHFNLGAQRLLGPANLCIRTLVEEFPRLDTDRLRSQARMLLGEDPRPEVLALHAPDQIQRFRDLSERHGAHAISLQDGIRNLLDFSDLYRVEGEVVLRNAIHLLTLHAAKGLEFREVYVCGLEDRMLPSARALNSDNSKEMEEQRRLLYVGITRAMDRLTLSCVRHRPGRNLSPSRFWEELQLERDEPTP